MPVEDPLQGEETEFRDPFVTLIRQELGVDDRARSPACARRGAGLPSDCTSLDRPPITTRPRSTWPGSRALAAAHRAPALEQIARMLSSKQLAGGSCSGSWSVSPSRG